MAQTNLNSSPSPAVSAIERSAKRATRSRFLKWLRKVHGWVGLWGAVLGLLFGVTGFLENHRAVLRIGTPGPVKTQVELPVPAPQPRDPRALAAWLGKTLQLDAAHARVTREPAQPVDWGGQAVMQPEHWQIRFTTPRHSVTADYWKNANTVRVARSDHGWLTVMQNLHRSNGVGVGWVLLADSIAGSLVLLSITGVILWTELNRRRTVGFGIFAASLITLVVVAGRSL
ncbi:PepSY-associated TM helix domain-containing protein [Robbsia sp. Bb-Pol-6]|uniref:PepSY-associated TM helix domain-containing protein n=1 Tax=Robbsia betulipollinis TaxID=2981849 RepID=A0ABT3ZGP7_9BURK|nr:PepSY-associated TM helix domain-containing protein [Robbsia betulipollinis]MCY0385699.1 PepSY-associated TM helix domain-containing protein [Robbsia betulipollinis]